MHPSPPVTHIDVGRADFGRTYWVSGSVRAQRKRTLDLYAQVLCGPSGLLPRDSRISEFFAAQTATAFCDQARPEYSQRCSEQPGSTV